VAGVKTQSRSNGKLEALNRALARSKVAGASLSRKVVTLAKELAASRRSIATRNDFLAMVVHDLRSPLTVINLDSGVLLKMMATIESGRPARKLVERIRNSADLMGHFISDLMDVASAEAGHMSFRPKAHAVTELLEDTGATLEALTQEKGLTLNLDIRVPLDKRVMCDRPRFLQLMSNLIGNAIKFTRRGGEITIGVREQSKHFFFWVKDTGVGIRREELPHIFDQYWRGERLSKDGFGLGLAIVRNLVEAQGGTVSVESTKNKGSTFAFTLPKAA
jgi:signal transduction histidine kinase